MIADFIRNPSLETSLMLRETRSSLSQPSLWTFHSLRPLMGTLPKSAWRERWVNGRKDGRLKHEANVILCRFPFA